MTTDYLPARWVLLASAGLACLLLALTTWLAPAWTAANFMVPLLLGVGLPPVVTLLAGLRLWWSSETTRLWLASVGGETQRLLNVAREAELKLAQQIAATDDDEPAKPHKATAAGVWNFFCAGDQLGFALDGLVECGVLSQPAWQRLKDFYLCWPEDGPPLRDRGGSVGTEWAPTWTLRKVGERLALGDLPLPLGAPPVVSVYVKPTLNTTQRKTTQKRGAASVVIDQ